MTENEVHIILMFRSHDRLLAIPLANVTEVVPAFELMQTPGLGATLAGMISLRGAVIPVIDVAVLIGKDATVLKPTHKFIIAKTSGHSLALLVDTMEELADISGCGTVEPLSEIGHNFFKGVVSVEDEMVLILNIEACASLDQIVLPIEVNEATHNFEGQIS